MTFTQRYTITELMMSLLYNNCFFPILRSCFFFVFFLGGGGPFNGPGQTFRQFCCGDGQLRGISAENLAINLICCGIRLCNITKSCFQNAIIVMFSFVIIDYLNIDTHVPLPDLVMLSLYGS